VQVDLKKERVGYPSVMNFECQSVVYGGVYVIFLLISLNVLMPRMYGCPSLDFVTLNVPFGSI
jgi:hypothetical protein